MIWVLAGFFAFVMGGVAFAGFLFLRSRVVLGGATQGAVNLSEEESLGAAVAGALSAVGSRVAIKSKAEETLRKQLFRAGYRSQSAHLVFYGIQAALSTFCLIAVGWGVMVTKDSLGAALIPALCAAGFGYLMPSRLLDYQMHARARRIRRGVAAALDLLVLALEAGQTLDQAMRDTAASLRGIHPDLCSELLLCHIEMSAGTSRVDALRRLGERCGDEELRKLAHVLIDSERFGASLGPALRTHSKFLRTRMRQRAQEQARKLGVKLVLPVFFLIFPSVLLVTLGPAYLQMRQFLDQFLK